MARLACVVIPGLPHHVTRRGNGRRQMFRNVYHHYTDYLSVAFAERGIERSLVHLGQWKLAGDVPVCRR
jgi:REP element-mobilizing transposase RayT